ncbi:MAG: hypothetical protein WAL34_04260 [Acidobacteriaceae bacterium]
MPVEFIIDPKVQATIERKMAFHWPQFAVGAYVGVRYAKNARGRITAICAKGNTDRFASTDPFGVLKIRMNDGTFRCEHPEHLYEASSPQLKLVG